VIDSSAGIHLVVLSKNEGHIVKKLLFITAFLGFALTGKADPILQDFFDDGVVETSDQFNGGFYVSGSGGSALEAGNKLQLSNAQNGSTYGVLSTNKFSWTPATPGADTLRTTWVVTDSDLKAKTSLLTFTWQSQDDFNGTPAISLVLDLLNTNATLNVDGSQVGDEILLDVDFGGSSQAFTVVAEFSVNSMRLIGYDALKDRSKDFLDVSFASGWGSFPTFNNIRLGASVNAKSNDGLVVEFDSVTVEAIPEPAVISLISLFGGGMIFSRRIFGRKKSDSNA
jgi:hypothetical protein